MRISWKDPAGGPVSRSFLPAYTGNYRGVVGGYQYLTIFIEVLYCNQKYGPGTSERGCWWGSAEICDYMEALRYVSLMRTSNISDNDVLLPGTY